MRQRRHVVDHGDHHVDVSTSSAPEEDEMRTEESLLDQRAREATFAGADDTTPTPLRGARVRDDPLDAGASRGSSTHEIAVDELGTLVRSDTVPSGTGASVEGRAAAEKITHEVSLSRSRRPITARQNGRVEGGDRAARNIDRRRNREGLGERRRVARGRGLHRRSLRGLLSVGLATSTTFDTSTHWRLSEQVSLRDESFGAFAYHHVNRRLVFLKSRELVNSYDDSMSSTSADEAWSR